jgi:hypothetical protein
MIKATSSPASRSFVLLAAAVLLWGCTWGCTPKKPATESWMKSVNSIKPGTGMNSVAQHLGRPDEKKHGETPLRPYPPIGAPEGVLGTLPPDTRYEQWIYKRGDSHFHVFFARTTTDPQKWEVIAVRSVPATAVY